MAKAKSRGARVAGTTNKNKNTLKVQRAAGLVRLDSNAAAYARLLADPCAAPLVHPVYPGGDAGFLFRADSVGSIGGGATDTSGILHWVPGYVNSSNTELLIGAASGSGANITATASGIGPGKAFLNANAFGARCVAACLKISYPGAESGRAGRLHYGHTQAGTIDSGDVVTVDGVAPLVQHYTRTPPEIVEIIWRPGIADTEFNDPNSAASAALRDRKSAITVAWAGLPVNTGLTFHFTAVYEWTPRPTAGVSTNTSGKNQSNNTMDQVLDALTRAGFHWVRNAAGAAGYGLAMGATAAISNAFGLMPANPMARSTLRFR